MERQWSERHWRTLVSAPKQRNTETEKAEIKAGHIPESWQEKPAKLRRGNASRSAVSAGIEHVFAHQKGPMDLCIRTTGLARAKAKIGVANLIYNIRRLGFLDRRHGHA